MSVYFTDFLDAKASPSTYSCECVTVSDFGDSYRIYRACELVNEFMIFKAPIDRESEDARNGAFILEVGALIIQHDACDDHNHDHDCDDHNHDQDYCDDHQQHDGCDDLGKER